MAPEGKNEGAMHMLDNDLIKIIHMTDSNGSRLIMSF